MPNDWQRIEAEARITEVLDRAQSYGPQTIVDDRGVFIIHFEARKKGLDELFAQPGPLLDRDFEDG